MALRATRVAECSQNKSPGWVYRGLASGRTIHCLLLLRFATTTGDVLKGDSGRPLQQECTASMTQQDWAKGKTTGDARPKHRVRLPSFIVQEPIGAGKVVKSVTSAVGVKPCAPCEQRAARLDRW